MTEENKDVLSSIAEERRRHVEEAQQERKEEVARSAASSSSELVKANDHGEVQFVINPSFFPYSVVNGIDLIARMNDRFGVRFEPPSLGMQLGGKRPDSLSEEQLAELPKYVNSKDLNLRFVDGLVSLNIGKQGFIPPTMIKVIVFASQNIMVSVVGTSDIAEMIAKECWEVLWDLAKGQTPRTFEELAESGLDLVSHSNATTIDLGANPKVFFRPEFVGTIERLFGSKDGLSANFRKDVRSSNRRSMPFDPIVNVDEVQFKIHIPTLSGTEEASLQFSVTRRNDSGTSRITLVTQLPYQDHLSAVEEIVTSLKG